MRTIDPLLVHPVRLRILGALSGRELTTRQLAPRLREVSQATLYRHVRALVRAGMLQVSRRRKVNGIVESTYRLVPGAAHLDRREFTAVRPAEHLRCFSLFTGAQLAEAQQYFGPGGYDPRRDGATYFRAGLLLTDAEARRLRLDLLALAKRYANRPEAGRRLRMLSIAFLPEPEGSPES